MPAKNLCRISPLLAFLTLSLAVPGAPVVAQDVTLERDPAPKLFVTDFTWYETNQTPRGRANPRSLACTLAQPRAATGEITESDYFSSGGYYAQKYRRFKAHGIDGVAFLVSDKIPDSFDGSNLVSTAAWATDAGLDVFAYYDLLVTSGRISDLVLCFPGTPCRKRPEQTGVLDYNINTRPQLYEQLKSAFSEIAENLVLPHLNPEPGKGGYAMLEDAAGQPVLDEAGLPRPIVAIFIAREFSDRPANLAKIGELLNEVTATYRGLGLGKPALVLDVIFWATPTEPDLSRAFDPEIVAAFGDHAVAITWYGFFDPFQAGLFGILNDGPRPPMSVWAKKLHQRYRQTADELVEGGFDLMLWPGVTSQIDTRSARACRQIKREVVYHLRSAADWRTMLDRGYRNTLRPAGSNLQTVLVVANAGEWFEASGIDNTQRDARGRCSFPFNWCNQLLEVLAEQDRFD